MVVALRYATKDCQGWVPVCATFAQIGAMMRAKQRRSVVVSPALGEFHRFIDQCPSMWRKQLTKFGALIRTTTSKFPLKSTIKLLITPRLALAFSVR
jgi:hypothetical protein